MQLTRAGEYGVLGMLNLARRAAGEIVMIDEVSQEEAIPRSFLAKVFQHLVRAGLVRSVRGSGGGVALARAPGEISVLEVIEAIEGPIALQRCLEAVPGCAQATTCPLCGVLGQAQHQVRAVFAATTLAALVQDSRPGGKPERRGPSSVRSAECLAVS